MVFNSCLLNILWSSMFALLSTYWYFLGSKFVTEECYIYWSDQYCDNGLWACWEHQPASQNFQSFSSNNLNPIPLAHKCCQENIFRWRPPSFISSPVRGIKRSAIVFFFSQSIFLYCSYRSGIFQKITHLPSA